MNIKQKFESQKHLLPTAKHFKVHFKRSFPWSFELFLIQSEILIDELKNISKTPLGWVVFKNNIITNYTNTRLDPPISHDTDPPPSIKCNTLAEKAFTGKIGGES